MLRLKRLFSLSAALALLTLTGTAMAADQDLKLSNKWRIECSESAKSDGVVRFLVTPKGGEAIAVEVPIADGRGENGVARDLRDGLRAALDPKRFKIETDDGEDVLVKRRSGQPNFELRLVESTVKAVRLNVQKE
jgi:hypothetical protein